MTAPCPTFRNALAVPWLIWDRVFVFCKSAGHVSPCACHACSWCEQVTARWRQGPRTAVARRPRGTRLMAPAVRTGKREEHGECHVNSAASAAMTDLDYAAKQACSALCLTAHSVLFSW